MEAYSPKEEPFTPIDATDASSTNLKGTVSPGEVDKIEPSKPTTTTNEDKNSGKKGQILILSLYMVSTLINGGINRTYLNKTNTINRIRYCLKRNAMSLLYRVNQQVNTYIDREIIELIPFASLGIVKEK